jgi:two-component system, response regulator, stage 0 sporulation protein F
MDKPEVLYVDDEPINLKLFEMNMGRKFKVHTAKSGPDGLMVLKGNKAIRIVITDMKMPAMNGLEFIRYARTENPSLVFFILTGYSITTDISDALEKKEIRQYFRKPFDAKDIERALLESIVW